MKKILTTVDKLTDQACFILMCVAFLITFFHIIGRYVLKMPIFYSEELARYCFVWSCMLGAAIVNRRNEHTSVTYFAELLPKKLQGFLFIFREIIILILLASLIYYGTRLSYTMRTVKTAAMSVSWAAIYMSLPVSSILLIISTIKLILEKARELKTARR
jgi:TRAP-type C4-dicarboxylate transport system permease small subunit